MTRQAKKTTPPPVAPAAGSPPESQDVDPLADLREPDHPADLTAPPVQVNAEGQEEEEAVVEVRPMVSQETRDQMVAEVVAAWHADPSSLGFLHGGGSMCGCRYMARVALQAAVPVMTEEDVEEKELEPSV